MNLNLVNVIILGPVCTRPISIRYSNAYTGPTGSRSILVPCGKCAECLKAYQSSWTVRLLKHLQSVGYMVYFTLTYNDSSVPLRTDPLTDEKYPSVDKSSMITFLKSFRKRLGHPCSYFITSEYGPRTLRPHLHGLLFSVSEFEFKTLFESYWNKQYGFTKSAFIRLTDSLAFKRIRYVCKYCSKGMFENPRVTDGLVDPTFHLISKGIGKSYLTDENINYHLSRSTRPGFVGFNKPSDALLSSLDSSLKINVAGFDYKLPRYYREAIFAKSKTLQSAYQDHVLQRSMLLRDDKFGLVLPDGSPNHEAFKIALDSDMREEVQREEDAVRSIVQSLDKSQI